MTVSSPEDDEAQEMGTVCPECAAHKCWNCDSTSWSDLTDEPTFCSCWAKAHKED